VHEYVIADVFTDVPLQGNQLAVFTDGTGLDDALMQRAARELNLSETVFVLPGVAGADARVRIFTPVSELPFAGHPVLGTAFVLGERLGRDLVRLQTGVGAIPIRLTRDPQGRVVFGEMDQQVPDPEPFARTDELLAALRVERSQLPIEAYRNGPYFVYVALEDEAAVAALSPDLGALAELGPIGVNCFANGDEAGVKTRVFAPALGVAEDPATGSAAGPLALHLVRHGKLERGRPLEIRQGAEVGRPSVLHARVEDEHVVVGGSAVIVARGEYRLA
jgi:trans-2,3-dihydro-3-hydroxyanthranilate isomerase